MATANTQHDAGEGLSAAAHVATAEAHEPRDAGIAGVGSSRPVDGRLHIGEGMAGRESRVRLGRVHQACQLLHREQPPPIPPTYVLWVAMTLGEKPFNSV